MNTADQGGDNADRFLAEAVSDEAVRARRTDRWVRQRANESTTILGTLERSVGSVLTIYVATVGEITGAVTLVGDDVVEVRASAATYWVPLAAIEGVFSDGPAAGPRSSHHVGPTLRELLADLSADRTQVGVTLRNGTVIRGGVLAVGESLVLGPTEPSERGTFVVGLDSLVLVSCR